MSQSLRKLMLLGALSVGLVGCASDIYAPPGGGDRTPQPAPQPPTVEEGEEPDSPRLSEQPQEQKQPEERAPSPGYQEQGDDPPGG